MNAGRPGVHALGMLVLGTLACGTATVAVNPDEASAQGHRAEAERERAAAEQEKARYDPAATRVDPSFAQQPFEPSAAQHIFTNPTETRLSQADWRLMHAQAHERAARELESFEAAECKGVPRKERAACPLLGPAVAIRDLPDGVRVELARPESIEPVVADMRCHYAFARTHGFSAEAAACPLYIRGIQIERSRDGQAIEIRGPTPEVAREIQKRARQEAVLAPQARPH
jgi:hypothetical protein